MLEHGRRYPREMGSKALMFGQLLTLSWRSLGSAR